MNRPYRPHPGQQGAQPRAARLHVETIEDKTLRTKFVYNNKCAVSPEDFPPNRDGSDHHILIRGGQPVGEYVVTATPIPGFPRGGISLTDAQRTWAGITMRDEFIGEIYNPFSARSDAYLGTVELSITFRTQNKKTDVPYDEEELSKLFIDSYQNQVLAPGQRMLMDHRNIPLLVVVESVVLTGLDTSSEAEQKNQDPNARGILIPQSKVFFHAKTGDGFKLKPSVNKPNASAIFAPSFKFDDLGIGGLDTQISTIFRRVFASRIFPPGIVAKMGIDHVKGLLLYGPPGTGKTLIARQLGKTLNAHPPKIVNGPEVLNKFVGQSEENIRKLFADAEKEYKEKGDESGLHIIIFDELDAVCKQRGSGSGGGTGVGDTVVNQLLAKLDGVDKLNNILLIGMTNRKDMIDEALLRPGRLEVQLEISLPDEEGRFGIIKIHTSKFAKNDILDHDVDLAELARLTKNYSGAEIAGLVKAAAASAFSRHTDANQITVTKDIEHMKVKWSDFLLALSEVRPAYGASEAELEAALSQDIIHYSPDIQRILNDMLGVAHMVKEDSEKLTSSIIFHGAQGSGKTALTAHIAKLSDIPFIRMITPQKLAGYRDDFAKSEFIHKTFSDAQKSAVSVVILDSIEQLIGWNPIGPRFSMTVLGTLSALITSPPINGHRLLVLATTSQPNVLKELDIAKDFEKDVRVPTVSNLRELQTVLQSSSGVPAGSIEQALARIHEHAGGDHVGIGIKPIIAFISEARMNQDSAAFADKFSNLVLTKMQGSWAR
ncbi:vesicle-fusing ATPase [Fusarium oxysporum NRRL 32931]|uniref:Vesicular-fusion protein SEC18 n=1 Tax=Fusarium oxysporum NRRL 32931 TaxID=660029 RepID=W9I0Z3_FUSOX|nr:vesicle-fusing ATPase [Fusarium oxysporum NRRL 32931]